MPEKQSFETIELQHLHDTKPDEAGEVSSAEAHLTHGTAALGLALYAASTVFNAGQSALAKLVGKCSGSCSLQGADCQKCSSLSSSCMPVLQDAKESLCLR